MTFKSIILSIATAAISLASYAQKPSAKAYSAERIWSENYASFTSIAKFKGNYYITFREGQSHIFDKNGIAAGKIRILKSKDGNNWESVALLEKDKYDLRDPKLSITPDGRLMVCIGGSLYVDKELKERHPHVSFSSDGKTFSDPEMNILSPDLSQDDSWIWRVTWYKGTGYAVDYTTDKHACLVKTTDGLHFSKVTDFDLPGFPNEATIRFMKDGKMTCLLRTDDEFNHYFWGESDAPYTSWTWKTGKFAIGGPEYMIIKDKIISCDRLYNPARTSILVGNIDDGQMEEALTLPSGGDTSYAGMLRHGKEIWICYYSSKELDRAAIYFTKIPIKTILQAAETNSR